MDLLTIFLIIVMLVGTLSVFVVVMILVSPSKDGGQIVDVTARRFKSSSSFAGLQPESKWMDRLAVFCLRTFDLEKPLEEMHMQLGSPDYPQPVKRLQTAYRHRSGAGGHN